MEALFIVWCRGARGQIHWEF